MQDQLHLVAISAQDKSFCGALEAAGLIHCDLDNIEGRFFALCAQNEEGQQSSSIYGYGGYQYLSTENSSKAGAALLRSIIILPTWRGTKKGARLVKLLEQQARKEEMTQLYLLTEGEDVFFANMGFAPLARESAPDHLRQTGQFSSLCSQNAVLMQMNL